MTITLAEVIATGQDPLDSITTDRVWEILVHGVYDREWRSRRSDFVTASMAKHPEYALEHGWELEVMANPDLVGPAIDLIRDPFDRLDVESMVEASRCGYPLEVEVFMDGWKCDGCGATFEPGVEPRVSVGERPVGTATPHNDGIVPCWCVGCLERAIDQAQEMRAAPAPRRAWFR